MFAIAFILPFSIGAPAEPPKFSVVNKCPPKFAVTNKMPAVEATAPVVQYQWVQVRDRFGRLMWQAQPIQPLNCTTH